MLPRQPVRRKMLNLTPLFSVLYSKGLICHLNLAYNGFRSRVVQAGRLPRAAQVDKSSVPENLAIIPGTA